MLNKVWVLWPNGITALQKFVKDNRCEAVENRHDNYVELICQDGDMPSLMNALKSLSLSEITALTKHEAYTKAHSLFQRQA